MRERLNRFVAGWLAIAAKHAWLVVTVTMALAAGSLWFAVSTVGINTNTSNMVPQDTPFRVAEDAYWDVFPEKANNILVVLQGPESVFLEQAADVLAQALAEEPARFADVYAPGAGDFFRENGLLYLSTDEVGETVDRLAGAQAALGKLSEDPSLRGLFSAFESALVAAENSQPMPHALVDAMARADRQC